MEKLINEFSFGLFFWQLLIFVGLILLLKKFAWKPILDSVNEREDSIKQALSSAEKARSEMQSLKEDNQKILKEAKIEREALLKEARNRGGKIVETAKKEARIEADKILKDVQERIENEKKHVIKDLKNQVAEFSIEIAEKVIAYYYESFELYANKEHYKAIQALQKAMVLNPYLPHLYIRLGSIYYDLNLKEMAILQWEKALELDSGNLKLQKFLEKL